MRSHRKRLIAPAIIAVLLALYYVGFFVFLLSMAELRLIFKLLLGIVPLALAGVAVFVLIERIHEVRSGEEDDLGKY